MFRRDLFFCVLVTVLSSETVNGIATEVRLVNNITELDYLDLKPYEGAIQVFEDGEWGLLSRHAVNEVTAKTICKILGYGFVGFLVERFSYTGVYKLSRLTCSGNETSISECVQEPVATQSGMDSSGVHCFDHVFNDVRLSGGATPNEGIVQVKMDGRWGLVCSYDQAFMMPPAGISTAVCRSLGYKTYNISQSLGGYTDDEVMLSWLDISKFSCTGSETQFNQCTFRDATQYQPRCYSRLVLDCITPLGSACTNDDICAAVPDAHCTQYICNCKEGYVQYGDMNCTAKYDFRLVPINDHDAEGLVEMKVNNIWALVTSDSSTFSDETAKVICATLGYGYTGFSTTSFPGLNVSSYTGYFYDKLIECTGTETRATECVTGDWVPVYQSTRTAYLTRLHCYEYLVTDIRLQGGVLPNEGRFEVQVDGRWGSVCLFSVAYGSINRPAICRLLGYITDSNSYPSMSSDNAERVDEVWMSHPNCNSTSMDINDCAVTKGVFDGCVGHGRDMLLKCDPIRLRDGATPNDGQIEAGIHGNLYSFCIDGFDINAANVTCTVLGYYGVTRLLTSDNIGTDIYNGTIICNGMEKSLEKCDLVDGGMINCKQADIAYVECHVAGKIIPSNNKSYEGVFVGYYMHKWMRIGNDVSEVTAKTICSILGFGYNGYAVTLYGDIGGGTGILTFMSCKGHESDVAECASDIYERLICHRCPAATFGTVKLYCSDYSIDGIRLVDGQSSTEGVIQVLVDGEWGHVCAIGWNTIATNIACKTRGFKSGVGFHSVDIANASILIGHVECQGSESNLNQCTYHKKGYYEHTQPCNNTIAIACTTECDVAWYGESCSTMCSCNANNSETSVNGRACDNVTGECACKKAWSGATWDDDANECLDTLICQEANTQCKNTVGGYECICVQDYEVNDNDTCVLVGTKTDISMLVIVVSSAVGGLLFIIVVATICFCTRRRRHPQGDLKDTPKKLPDSRVANSNVLAMSIRSITNEESTTP